MTDLETAILKTRQRMAHVHSLERLHQQRLCAEQMERMKRIQGKPQEPVEE